MGSIIRPVSTHSAFSSFFFGNRPEAYATLEETQPDLIITCFPLNHEESGMDLVRSARKRTGCVIPAILITGDTSPSLGELHVERVETLIKPTDPDELINAAWRNMLNR